MNESNSEGRKSKAFNPEWDICGTFSKAQVTPQKRESTKDMSVRGGQLCSRNMPSGHSVGIALMGWHQQKACSRSAPHLLTERVEALEAVPCPEGLLAVSGYWRESGFSFCGAADNTLCILPFMRLQSILSVLSGPHPQRRQENRKASCWKGGFEREGGGRREKGVKITKGHCIHIANS